MIFNVFQACLPAATEKKMFAKESEKLENKTSVLCKEGA
jgi:hypothetical protein